MDTFKSISVEKAHEIMESGPVTLIDIRDPQSYLQGHIHQAQTVNDENISTFMQTTDKEIPLICYCYHGISSQQAADFFANQGFKQVYSIEGGWEKWKESYG